MGQVYKWCKVAEKVLPIEQCADRMERPRSKVQIINDEMEATKHPIDGKHYTSKTRFREVTRSHGYAEVGNEYAKGYDPHGKEREERERVSSEKFKKMLSERL